MSVVIASLTIENCHSPFVLWNINSIKQIIYKMQGTFHTISVSSFPPMSAKVTLEVWISGPVRENIQNPLMLIYNSTCMLTKTFFLCLLLWTQNPMKLKNFETFPSVCEISELHVPSTHQVQYCEWLYICEVPIVMTWPSTVSTVKGK